MKVVIIYCVKAFYKDLKSIYSKVDVSAYSEFDVKEYIKKRDKDCEAENWFAGSKNYYDSVATFAFIQADKCEDLLQQIRKFNEDIDCCSPMHAYVLNVEQFI